MALISCHTYSCIRCSSSKSDEQSNYNVQKLNCVNVNGTTKSFPTVKIDLLSKDHGSTITPFDSSDRNAHSTFSDQLQIRQNIPTEKQLVDACRLGVLIEEKEGIVFRQTVVVRSCEVGPDKTTTIESVLNLLQETAMNHAWLSGLLGDNGFGATHAMIRNNLIWVISRMHVQVYTYPVWGEVLKIETWMGASGSGKYAMQRDWLIRSQATGLILACATSTWAMMNQHSRRLSKIPDDVRVEIKPMLTDKQTLIQEVPEKIHKLDDNSARHVLSNLKPKRSDLDFNQHVNNVKYVGWMLEIMPEEFLENHQLSSIVLEYRKECGSRDVVQSLCNPDDDQQVELTHHQVELTQNITGIDQKCNDQIDFRHSLSSVNLDQDNAEYLGCLNQQPLIRYTHLLQIKGQTKNQEILRGKTGWKKKTSE